ncbi:MAG: hypothetical protein C5B47_01205 [Verrucomicrobia bacterium]|nr:MAG: hypothetical protein C5B47_01205 [Verrucomicrobiota bacterium]
MIRKVSRKINDYPIWITQTEAAALRKVTTSTIAYLLRRERLRSKTVNGRKMVCREDAIAFRSSVGRHSKNVMQTALAGLDRDEWITQQEAARLRNLTIYGIKGAIRKGRIRTLKRNNVIFVRKEDVLNYQPRIDFHPEFPLNSVLPSVEDWITVAEAASLRGVSESMITKHVTSQRIRSIKKGDTRLVYREDIIHFKDKPRPGRPKKK